MASACFTVAGTFADFPPFLKTRTAFAQEKWKQEFDDICSKTGNAADLKKDELQALIGRCDKLAPEIGKLGGPGEKVYMKRLSMCRALFVFMLDQKAGAKE